jgi:hypothetical protein
VVFAILRALSRAVRRDLGTFGSLKVNNFFFFVALLIWGALNSGLPPRSAYPFLLLLGLLLLFPLSSDPLSRIPADRLALWPLGPAQRLILRVVSMALSPVLWLTLFLMLKTAPALAAAFLALAIAAQAAIILAGRRALRAPRWNPVRFVPPLPGRTGELVRNNVREMLAVLDVYIAAALSLGGSLYRWLTANPDTGAYPILAMLVALALSSYAQVLFSLDGGPDATRYRLLPLRGWQILGAKDAAYLLLLLILGLPLSPLPGLTFGLTALAIGHFPSVLLRLPQRRWRFTGGRAWLGVAQMLIGFTLGFAESQTGIVYFLAAAAGCASSTVWCGRIWDRRFQR